MPRTYQEDLALIQSATKTVEAASATAQQLHAKKQSVADRMAELVKDVETMFGTSEPEKLTELADEIIKENNVSTNAYIASANSYAAEIARVDAELKAIGG